jgi:hypothetical protein
MFSRRVQESPPSSERYRPEPTPPYTRAPLLRLWSHNAAKMRRGLDGSMAMSTPPVVSSGGASTCFQSLPPLVTR